MITYPHPLLIEPNTHQIHPPLGIMHAPVHLVVSFLYTQARVCRGDKLWIPSGTESQRNNDFVQDAFPSLGRFENVYIERKDGGSILTPAAFDRALQLHNAIIATTWDNAADDGSREISYVPQPLKFTDLCLNRNSGEGVPEGEVLSCEMANPLELFSYTSAAWATPATLLAGLNDPEAWPTAIVSRGFVLNQVLGDIERDAQGQVTGAKVISLQYFLAGNQTLIDDQKEDKPAKEWEQEVLDLLEVCGCGVALAMHERPLRSCARRLCQRHPES